MSTTTTAATPVAGTGPSTAALQKMAGRYDGPRDIGDQLRLATALAGAKNAVPEMYLGNAGDILAAIYQAMALDVSVMTALQQFTYNKGKSGMSGALMLALIIRAGHRVEHVTEPSDKKVHMRLVRCDDQPDGETSWTLAEAAVAKLTNKTIWQMYPSDLLYWRCVSRLARRFAADVVQGFGYTPEELSSINVDDVDSAAIEVREPDPDVVAFLSGMDDPETGARWDHAATTKKWKASLAGLLRESSK